jgi:tetratricopeptide (TPR) repeat protein
VQKVDGSPRDPGPDLNPGGNDGGLIPPVDPNPDRRVGIAPITPPNATTGGGTGFDDSNPPPDVIDDTQAPPKGNSGGVIRIGPSSGGSAGTVPPTSDADAEMSAKSLVEVARSHYVRGDYAKSAAAYEKALRAGAEPASTNHRLGGCYRNLGQKADAIRAYERAIQGYQAQIDRGASPDIPKSGIAACQQALKVLRGG